jgi:hypothetical protein
MGDREAEGHLVQLVQLSQLVQVAPHCLGLWAFCSVLFVSPPSLLPLGLPRPPKLSHEKAAPDLVGVIFFCH